MRGGCQKNKKADIYVGLSDFLKQAPPGRRNRACAGIGARAVLAALRNRKEVTRYSFMRP